MSIPLSLAVVFWGLCGGASASGAPGQAAWSLPPTALAELCDDALRRAETALRIVAAVSRESRDFANTPEALETGLQNLEDAAAPAVLMGYVAVSSEARSAGAQCRDRLDAFAKAVLARPELCRALDEYAARKEVLSGEKRLLFEGELADWRGGGCGLDREARLELRFVRERLTARERGFLDNLDWPRPRLLFSPEELSGLPQNFLQGLPRQGRLLQVEAEPDAYQAFLASVRDPAARQRMEFLYHNRAAVSNVPVLQEILALRGRVAALLDMKSFARLALAGGLVPEPGKVRGILEGLAKRLRPDAKEELAAFLLAIRQSDVGSFIRQEQTLWSEARNEFRDFAIAH